MKTRRFVALSGGLLAASVVGVSSAFQPIVVAPLQPTRTAHTCRGSSHSTIPGGGVTYLLSTTTTVEIDENAPRDVYAMEEWAANCGVQTSDGFRLVALSEDGGVQDYSVVTDQDVPAGSPLLFVPSQMILSSNVEFSEELAEAEDQLARAGLGDQIPLFRLFIRILAEYEKGDQSPYFPWLNSLPRRYNNGASMTYACFDCLPPYVALLAKNERSTFKKFHKVLHNVPFIDGIVLTDRHLVKFAYNAAVTRSFDCMDGREKRIVPMADMFNHGGAEPEVDISHDEEGNCIAYATRDVPAGSPLRICLGDSTNPSPLFAKYGFLDESSPGTFSKLMHLKDEMGDLNMETSDLLFYKNGDISPGVWDVVLYSVLAPDPNLQQGFYQAYMSGDDGTKQSYHQEYFPYTLEALQRHVDGMLGVLDRLSDRALSYDPATHPRIPVILRHNSFVRGTFTAVKANLDAMASEYDSGDR